MGCVNSKTADETSASGRKTNPNAPTNLAPLLSSPMGTKPEGVAGGGIPLQAKTSNSYSMGSGGVTSPSGVGYTDSDSAPPPTAENQQKVYMARYAYQARTKEDLSFEKGETLLVVGLQESDWWMAKSLKTQREGYIPRNYVAEAQSYEAEE